MGHLTESEPVSDPCEDPSPGAQSVRTCSPEVGVKDMGTPQHRSRAVNDVLLVSPQSWRPSSHRIHTLPRFSI